MSDREGLLQAIVEAPDDDAPRLVFADWLEENGHDAHSRFIRMQCSLPRAEWPDEPWHDPIDAVALFEVPPSLRPALLGPLLPLVADLPALGLGLDETQPPSFDFTLRRGFVEGMIVHEPTALKRLLQHAETALAAVPLRQLRVHGPVGYGPLEQLLSLPAVERLQRLELIDVRLNGGGLKALLLAHPRLRLQMLHVTGHQLEQEESALLTAAFGSALILGPDSDEIPF